MSPGPPHRPPPQGPPADTERVVELLTRPATAAVLVLGEMGMGKSALLDGAAAALGERLEVLRLHGSPALAKVPYSVLAPFLGNAHLAESGSRVEVLRAFWRAVEALRQKAAADLLLVIDDAHELDPASSEVVAELVSARWAKAALAAPSGAALPRPLMELWLDDGVERVDLAPLAVDEVHRYLEAKLGGPVLPTVPLLLWRESGGNPSCSRASSRRPGRRERCAGTGRPGSSPASFRTEERASSPWCGHSSAGSGPTSGRH
ncbi:AAA family ATPase [Sinomonas atrocyanea]